MASPKNGQAREAKFRRVMAGRGVRLERPKRIFRFARTTYRADWYDAATDRYYEALGSRQRKWAIVAILDLMDVVYPQVELSAVLPDGEPVMWAAERRLRVFTASFTLGAEINALITRLGWTYTRFAKESAIPKGSLYGYMSGRFMPTADREAQMRAALARLAVKAS